MHYARVNFRNNFLKWKQLNLLTIVFIDLAHKKSQVDKTRSKVPYMYTFVQASWRATSLKSLVRAVSFKAIMAEISNSTSTNSRQRYHYKWHRLCPWSGWQTPAREKKSKHVLHAGIVLPYGGMLTATHLASIIIMTGRNTPVLKIPHNFFHWWRASSKPSENYSASQLLLKIAYLKSHPPTPSPSQRGQTMSGLGVGV